MTYEGALYWHTHIGATIEQEIEWEPMLKRFILKILNANPICQS